MFLISCQLPFPSPIPLGKEGTEVAEISPQHMHRLCVRYSEEDSRH